MMRPITVGALAFVFTFIIAQLPSVALADPPSRTAHVRALVRAMAAELRPDDAQALVGASSVGDDCWTGKNDCSGELSPEKVSDLRRIAARLMQRGDWRSAAVTEAVPRVALDRSPPAVTQAIRTLVEHVTKDAKDAKCGASRAATEAFVARRQRDPKFADAPLSRASLEETGCLKAALGASPKDLEHQALVSVFGFEGDTATIVLGNGTLVDATSFLVGTRRVFLAAVPRDVVVTVRLAGAQRPSAPYATSRFTNDDVPIWTLPDAYPKCIDLAMDRRSGETVLVNGTETTLQTLHVADGRYDVSIVRLGATEAADAHVATKTVSEALLKGRTECVTLAFDLKAATSVAVTNIIVAPSCLAAGIDSDRIRSRVMGYLGRAGMQARDIRGWADTLKGLDELRGGLRPSRGRPTGADKEEGDSWQLIGDSGAELARQGFASTLSVALQCGGNHRDEPSEFTILASAIDVDKIERARRDYVSGFDVSNVAHTEVEATHREEELSGALMAVLSRLYRRRYARFLGNEAIHAYAEDLDLPVELYLPRSAPSRPDPAPARSEPSAISAPASNDPYAPVKNKDDSSGARASLTFRRLDDGEDASVCGAIENDQQLRSSRDLMTNVATEDADNDLGAASKASAEVESTFFAKGRTNQSSVNLRLGDRAGTHRTTVRFRPPRPGVYVVQLVAHDGTKRLAEASYQCVDVRERRTAVSLEIGRAFALTGLGRGRDARAEDLSYTYVMAALAVRTSPHGFFNLGFSLGYARADHGRDATASWDDLGVTSGTASGSDGASATRQQVPSGPVLWSRSSVLVGPTLTIAGPICDLSAGCGAVAQSFSWFLRATPMVDVGTIDVSSETARRYPAFFDRSDRWKLDSSFFGQAGLSFSLGAEKYVSIVGSAILASWTDLLFGQPEAIGRATYVPLGAFAIGAAAGYRL